MDCANSECSKSIINNINKGAGIMFYSGHGNPTNFDLPKISSEDINNLINSAKDGFKEKFNPFQEKSSIINKDPNKNKDAQRLNLMDFDVMYKLALEGANVLHPDAVKLAKEKGVEIRIVYYKTGEVGTIIK